MSSTIEHDELKRGARQLLKQLKQARDGILTKGDTIELAEAFAKKVLAHIKVTQTDNLTRLKDNEREFLLRVYDNATTATPRLTELRDSSEMKIAKALSEQGLLTFTSFPNFVLLTTQGQRFVDGEQGSECVDRS